MNNLTNNIQPKLGEGIFTIRDISNILELPPSKIRHWLTEFWDKRFGSKFGRYSFGEGNNKAVNFYTLIEFITFAKLREQNISAQKIQKFHKKLSETLKTPFPFAKTKLLTDKRSVWFEHADEIIKLDGKNQLSFKKILSPFLNKIEFDKEKIALRFYPLGKGHMVVIDPKHQFGQPIVAGTNIKATTIYSFYIGKETKKNICSLYNISKKQVNDAIEYCKKIAA